ncbi:hypothetical protein KDL29_16615, partial [bacterium]|nr:hypothetical protein [bacterium]
MDTRLLAAMLACMAATGCMRGDVQQHADTGGTTHGSLTAPAELVSSTPLAAPAGAAPGFSLLDPQQSGLA